jgi:hypothetical protein
MPEQIQIRVTGMAMTARYGTLSAGTILRTDAAFAKHLVEECKAAEYIEAPAEAVAAPAAVKSAAVRKPKAK